MPVVQITERAESAESNDAHPAVIVCSRNIGSMIHCTTISRTPEPGTMPKKTAPSSSNKLHTVPPYPIPNVIAYPLLIIVFHLLYLILPLGLILAPIHAGWNVLHGTATPNSYWTITIASVYLSTWVLFKVRSRLHLQSDLLLIHWCKWWYKLAEQLPLSFMLCPSCYVLHVMSFMSSVYCVMYHLLLHRRPCSRARCVPPFVHVAAPLLTLACGFPSTILSAAAPTICSTPTPSSTSSSPPSPSPSSPQPLHPYPPPRTSSTRATPTARLPSTAPPSVSK